VAGRRARGARRPSPRSQHFLRSAALAEQIVRDAGVCEDELVVDLGAGSGRLTAQLARVARHVIAIELDAIWAARLRERWPNVSVIEGDARQISPPSEPFRVVANLPFDRTTDLLHLLLDDPATPLIRADLIVEWSVAVKRALPWPSTLNDVLWGSLYETSLARRLPRTLFEPAPSVDAGLLIIRRRAKSLVPADLATPFRRYVSAGFRHGLARVAKRQTLRRLGLHAPAARDLDPYQWADVFLSSL
jgi:23S rRNA (adenine-N6)-dimethyltransferase